MLRYRRKPEHPVGLEAVERGGGYDVDFGFGIPLIWIHKAAFDAAYELAGNVEIVTRPPLEIKEESVDGPCYCCTPECPLDGCLCKPEYLRGP